MSLEDVLNKVHDNVWPLFIPSLSFPFHRAAVRTEGEAACSRSSLAPGLGLARHLPGVPVPWPGGPQRLGAGSPGANSGLFLLAAVSG